jgi:hypothetical protein
MSRIVIVILIYHRHKPIDVTGAENLHLECATLKRYTGYGVSLQPPQQLALVPE